MTEFLITGAVIALVWGLVEFSRWAYPGYDPIEFTKDAWATADPEKRGHMVEDLLERHQLLGMTRPEIIDFLGERCIPQKEFVEYLLG